jgi:trigger factor
MSVLINSDTEIGYQVEELARWRRRLAVQVPVHAAQRVHEQTVRDFAKRARLKGFRRGKAPTQIVERQYGPEIDQEVLKRLVQEGFEQAIARSGLEPIVAPQFEGVERTEEGGLRFAAEFDVRPEIELGRTTGFSIERKTRETTQTDVDDVIERMRRERADWRSVNRAAQAEDRVVFDSTPISDDDTATVTERQEDQVAELGADGLIPEFETGLTGLEPGAEETINVQFPDDHPNEMLRGSHRSFRIEVKEVRERVLPELDDDFARSLGQFDSLGEARDKIRANLEAEVAMQSQREVNEALVDEIIDANPIDLPESMVDQYLANMIGDQRQLLADGAEPERLAEVRDVLKPGAERALRRYYILNSIADREGLRATETDVDQAIADRVDPSKSSVTETRRQLERSGELDDLRFHLTMERVFVWLREHSDITPELPEPISE